MLGGAHEVDRESISLGREIGRGEFGVVMEASAVNLGGSSRVQTVAVKLLKARAGESASREFMREAKRLQSLHHDHVVRLLGVCFSSEPLMIVLEHMANGDLKAFLRSQAGGNELTPQHLMKIAIDASSGFAYLQGHGFVHRDLAARNVLLSGHFEAKIGDFGMARQLYTSEVSCTVICGVPLRAAVRSTTLNRGRRNPSRGRCRSGGWRQSRTLTAHGMHAATCGCLACCCGVCSNRDWAFRYTCHVTHIAETFSWAELPWKGVADFEVMKRLQNREKLSQPQACPDSVYSILLECWKIDARMRISAAGIEQRLRDIGYTGPLAWPSQARQLSVLPASDGAGVDDKAVVALEVAAERIRLGKLLGEGEFGSVYRGVLTRASGDTVDVAVKTVKDDHGREQFASEAKLLASLRHSSIVTVLAVCFTSSAEQQMIALELMAGGDLLSYLQSHQDELRSNVALLSSAVLQIAEAMMYLAARKILHRDLAARYALRRYIFICS